MAKLALRFISGKYKGGEYVLVEDKEIFIGRSSGIELVLMEDMVSRKHARVTYKDGVITLEDLGSTNGSFVNGEKITKVDISKGDRILIGTSIMKVVDAAEDREGRPAGSTDTVDGTDGTPLTKTHMSRSMTGTINEVPLPDLIQLFSTSKKSGTLVISRKRTVGKIHLQDGNIVYASIDTVDNLPPLKALFRILSWDQGTFDLVGPEAHDFKGDKLSMPTEHILMDGLRQMDEFRHSLKQLPPLDGELSIVAPLKARLGELDEPQLDVVQLVLNGHKLQQIFDNANGTDSDIAKIVIDLIGKKYIKGA